MKKDHCFMESNTNSLKVYTVHDIMYWAQCKWVTDITSNPHSAIFYWIPIIIQTPKKAHYIQIVLCLYKMDLFESLSLFFKGGYLRWFLNVNGRNVTYVLLTVEYKLSFIFKVTELQKQYSS